MRAAAERVIVGRTRGRAMESAEDIVRLIEGAFAGVHRGKVTLHETLVMDAYGDDRRRRKARARDPELDWSDVPDASLEECTVTLSFVDPVSWRFYLPAYMRWALLHFQDSRNWIVDHAIYSLKPGGHGLGDRDRSRFELLTPEQAEAVRQFLEFASQHGDTFDGGTAQDALDAYWSAAGGV